MIWHQGATSCQHLIYASLPSASKWHENNEEELASARRSRGTHSQTSSPGHPRLLLYHPLHQHQQRYQLIVHAGNFGIQNAHGGTYLAHSQYQQSPHARQAQSET